jgi:nicotinamidase-related amidase
MIPTDPGTIGETPALLIIDPQHDFLDPDGAVYCPSSSVSDTEQVINNINTLVSAARDAELPVIWTKEIHRPDHADYGAEVLSIEKDHTIAESEGEKFVDDLYIPDTGLPAAEYLVEKRRYNCFHNTDLMHLLSTFEVDTVLIAGVTTNVCVHYTAQGAHERDFVFRVIEECTAGTSQSLHNAALEMVNYLQPGGVQPLASVTAELKEYPGNPVVEKIKKDGSVI